MFCDSRLIGWNPCIAQDVSGVQIYSIPAISPFLKNCLIFQPSLSANGVSHCRRHVTSAVYSFGYHSGIAKPGISRLGAKLRL